MDKKIIISIILIIIIVLVVIFSLGSSTNAKKVGVKSIITNSINLKSCEKNLKIKRQYPEIVKLAVGLYPEKTLKPSNSKKFEFFVQENIKNIIALGEIGLDFSYEKPTRKLQEKVFIKELELARRLNLPVIIHTRKAEQRVLEILEDFKDLKIILHCFHGNFKLIKKAEELGCYFSIPTSIVRSEHFQKMIKEISKEKILTETDAPYMSPFKEKQNEPAFIQESIKTINKIWNLSSEKTENILENNFKKIFTTD